MRNTAIKHIAIPILLGIACIAMEYFLASDVRPAYTILLCFGTGAAFTAGLLLACRRYTACGWFAVSACGGIMLLLAAVLLFSSDVHLNHDSVYIVAANWAAVMILCVFARFVKKEDDPEDFRAFFRLGSIVFFVFYIAALGYALFFQASVTRREIWGINLVPGTTILYLLRDAVNWRFTATNLAANLLLFVPFGFYLPLIAPRMKAMYKIGLFLLVPAAVEAVQYLCAVGITDIDDVLLNFIGALLGMGLLSLMEALFRKRRGGDARLFVLFNN